MPGYVEQLDQEIMSPKIIKLESLETSKVKGIMQNILILRNKHFILYSLILCFDFFQNKELLTLQKLNHLKTTMLMKKKFGHLELKP